MTGWVTSDPHSESITGRLIGAWFAYDFLPSGRSIFIHVEASSAWDARQAILRTRFAGPAGIAEVVAWRAGLHAAAASIPRLASFRLLVDLRGYEVAAMDPAVHKVHREVIPLFLSCHHFRSGFIDFFGVKGDIDRRHGDIRCLAVAHVHHEGPKMDLYRKTLSRQDENFFSSLSEAEAWITAQSGQFQPLEKNPI